MAPDDLAWLADRLAASPLLDEALVRNWRLLLPFLVPDQRYELAATLLSVEQATQVAECAAARPR